MLSIIMLRDLLEIKKINSINVILEDQINGKNKPEEREKIIKYPTNEVFENYQGKKLKVFIWQLVAFVILGSMKKI
jgi:hypothetical protein